MKLSDCKIGTPIITEDDRVGHVVGYTYNILLEDTKRFSNKELLNGRIIPLVLWPSGEKYGIHHHNIKIFKS